MARTKLKRLLKLSELPNIFSIKNPDIKELLNAYFKNDKLFTLEIGCGHGDYSVELAKKYSGRNFVGIDIKGARVYKGAIHALELKLTNVAFILTKAENLNKIFTPNSIEEIYIPFPEPHQKRSHQDRRLLSSDFIKLYIEILADSGKLHFKTDNSELYKYAIKNIMESDGIILQKTEDFHSYKNAEFDYGILTTFEKHYMMKSRKIKYICARF
jgi:tRNA (guanine-N7-)-methyltransferase